MRRKSGEVVEKWINIIYDYALKYYKECKLQGHNEKKYYVIHPELYPKKEKEKDEEKNQGGQNQNKKKNKEYNIKV